jgi:GMP synthase (glutamine-hydrolysing)
MNPRAPVLVLQNLSNDTPAYLGRWLREHGVAHHVLDTEAGDHYPPRIEGYAALALLGGAMSANDDLPSPRQAESLILQAMARGIPVLGHDPLARAWFGTDPAHTVMQWHYEAFGLPDGAHWLASSAACPHQAFGIGPHLALQFHLEIDEAKLRLWVAEESAAWRAAQAAHGSVQDASTILAQAAQHLGAHQRLADRIYRRWLAPTGWMSRIGATM